MKASVQTLLQQWPQWRQHCAPGAVPVLHALQQCRSRALGYHLYQCSACTQQKMQYHSCRNRHCPNCGTSKQQQWVEARLRELLPCKYYHVVFTLPHALNSLVLGNRRVMYKMLFDAAHDTLQCFGNDPRYLGARAGIISVLHTWGQNLSFHPHVHCIVSGGGQDATGRWQEGKKTKYGVLYPVQAMQQVYRGRFMHLLKKGIARNEIKPPNDTDVQALQTMLYTQRWVVYAKQPFGGPQQVVEYLGRYTHKVAISNHRIRSIDPDHNVTFEYKDYAAGGIKKLMTLEGAEFLRRFSQHILPKGFCKVRSAGIYTNHGRKKRIEALLQQLRVPRHPEPAIVPWHVLSMERTGVNPLVCAHCKKGTMQVTDIILPQKGHTLPPWPE